MNRVEFQTINFRRIADSGKIDSAKAFLRVLKHATLLFSFAFATHASANAASCMVPRFSFHLNEVSQATMALGSGKSCNIVLAAGGRSRFDGARITANPRNGTATASTIGIRYRAKPGFHGSDSFEFAVRGNLSAGPGTATVRVNVQVQ